MGKSKTKSKRLEEVADRIAKYTLKADFCAKKATYLNIVGFIAVGVIQNFHYFRHIRNLGTPATFLGFSSSERLTQSAGIAALLELVGFFAVNTNVTSIIFALVYMTAVTRGIYDAAFIVSRSINSVDDDFNSVIDFSTYFYNNISSQKLPNFINTYQRTHRCCGWGNFHWMKWAKQLNDTHLPDSCCRAYYPDCGRNKIPRRPSGYLFLVQAASPALLQATLSQLSQIFGMQRWEPKRSEIHRYWLQLYPGTDRDRLFDLWNPLDPVSRWYLRLIDEEFVEEYEAVQGSIQTTVAILVGSDLMNSRALIYYTKGLEEMFRIESIAHPSPCELTNSTPPRYELPDLHRGVNRTMDINILTEIQLIMQPVRYYGAGLALVYFLMFLVFFHYFRIVKAFQLATEDIPVDFKKTGLTTTAFMKNPGKYIPADIYQDLIEKATLARALAKIDLDALNARCDDLKKLHSKGRFLKRKKIRQPHAPKTLNDPEQIDRYQIELLGRVPPRFYPAMTDRFVQEPYLKGGYKDERKSDAPLPYESTGRTSLPVPSSLEDIRSAKRGSNNIDTELAGDDHLVAAVKKRSSSAPPGSRPSKSKHRKRPKRKTKK